MSKKIESGNQDEESPSQPKKLFHCPKCETTCSTSGALRKHKSRKHRKQIIIPEGADPCICYRCNIKFKKLESSISHITKFHRQRYVAEAEKTTLKDTTDSFNQQIQRDGWIYNAEIQRNQIQSERIILNYLDSFLCVTKALHNNLDAFLAIFEKHS